jgi:hypothetical protein
VDGATKQVEKGAKQIGQGQAGPGFKAIRSSRAAAKFSGDGQERFKGARVAQIPTIGRCVAIHCMHEPRYNR